MQPGIFPAVGGPSQLALDRFLSPILASRLQLANLGQDDERKTVAMVFYHVTESTAAAEGLDPEEWTGILKGAFEYMIRSVYKYAGTVARLIGNCKLAFFGAPIAH